VNAQSFLRVAVVAALLTGLSFAAGVAGDLSNAEPPRSGSRIVVRIPPEIPDNAVRAAPLPPLLTATSATAAPLPFRRFEITPLQPPPAPAELSHHPVSDVILPPLLSQAPEKPAQALAKPAAPETDERKFA
jgi:hypothetical protein